MTLVRRSLQEECGELEGQRVLVAVSGGGDSQVMLDVLARLAPKLGFSVFAHGVDHGLRREAGSELDLAQALAARVGVPFARTRLKLEPGPNLQARAREARYAVLRGVAAQAGGALIATAHHADDRAETLLLRLLRGSGPRGLAVLAPRSDDLLRPLLRAAKADVLLHLGRHGLAFAEDPSNANAAFLRVRVRRELLPLMTQLAPQIVRHLNALADALAGTELPAVSVLPGAPELNGAQIREVLRASRLGRPVTIRVAGGRDVVAGSTRRPAALVEPKGTNGTTAAKRPPESKR